jgi:hypothetical protein
LRIDNGGGRVDAQCVFRFNYLHLKWRGLDLWGMKSAPR